MINVKVSAINKKALDQHLDFVKKLILMKTDKKFQKYIQQKCLETVKRVTDELMKYSGATVDAYKNNHKIEETENGFILYNDTVVESGEYGVFPIALAFEYGTGIVGSQNAKEGAWAYNINNHIGGWWYPTDFNDPNPYKWIDKDGNVHAFTKGLYGMEIYKKTEDVIKRQLSSWVMNYYEGKEVQV